MDSKSPAPNTADKMKFVKAACDEAPSGPTKDSALEYYQAAEKWQKAWIDSECNRELDTARHALG